MNTHRPDPNDLTPLIVRLPKHEGRPTTLLAYALVARIAFWVLALGAALVFIAWGIRQML